MSENTPLWVPTEAQVASSPMTKFREFCAVRNAVEGVDWTDATLAVSLRGSKARLAQFLVKAGGGTRGHAEAVRRFAEAAGAAVVLSPGSTGVLPDGHPQNMHVGGSKGSISGNFAMGQARLLIVIGSRGVCQSDCSGIGYPLASQVININADLDDVQHYNNTLPLHGDIGAILTALSGRLAARNLPDDPGRRLWLSECVAKKREWSAFKAARFGGQPAYDDVWQRPVLTQPQAIKAVAAGQR